MTYLPLHVVSETSKQITLGWTPIPCEGYEFLVNAKRVSNTWDQNASQVKFGKVANGKYEIRALGISAAGTYPPPVTPPADVPFGSRPGMPAPNRFVGLHNPPPIIGKSIEGLGNFGETIAFEGCTGIATVQDNDFVTPGFRIYMLNSQLELRISGNRGKEAGRNFVQADKCDLTGYLRVNLILGGVGEDVISMIGSGGTSAANPLYVERNKIEGLDWTSGSGSGIMIEGDDPSRYRHVVARWNDLVNCGQVAIGAHHPGAHIIENRLYSDGKVIPGRGIIREAIDIGDARSVGCEVKGNLVDWRNSSGQYAPYTLANNPEPADFGTNDFQKRFTASELADMRPVFS